VRALIALGFALAIAALVRAPGHWGGHAVDRVFAQAVYDAAAGIGAVLCLWRASAVDKGRAAWSLIALAFVLELAGSTVYAVLYGASGGPVPSVADAFWVAFYVPMAAALVLRVRAAGGVPRAVILDVMIAAATLGSISAAFAADVVTDTDGGSLAHRLTALAYPVGDLVLVLLVLQLAAANAWRLGRAATLVAGCFLLWAVTDTVHAAQTAHGTYVAGGVLDLGWIFPFVLLGAAAWLVPDPPTPFRRTAGGRALVVPVGFAIVAVVMVLYSGLVDANLVAVALAATALACLVARFALIFRRHLALVARTGPVLDVVHDAFMSFDERGLVTDWNSAAEATFGWSREEVLGRDFVATFLPEDRREAQRRHMSHFLATGEDDVLDRRLERTVLHRDGRTIPIELMISSQETDDGYTFNAFLRDITARREVETAKDEFVAIVSHELRTPLTSIRGSLGLLASGVLDSEPAKAERMLEVALENTDRLVRLVNDMLDIERIESGTVHLARQACDAGQLVHDAADAMRTAAMLAGVTLDVPGGHGALWADPDRVLQTLTNLISNAIKFSPEGATVWLGVDARGDEIVFAVRDEGRGIPPDKLELIFERFQQVDSSDAREKGGTGLGLAICRSIVEQHGGRIWAESVGDGSTFQFTLPAAPAIQSPRTAALAGAVGDGSGADRAR
jgi:PAS domain S-box-containing protein